MAGLRRFFVASFWGILVSLFERSRVISLFVIGLIAMLIFLLVAGYEETGTLLGIPIFFWIGVAGSVLAAFIFSLLVWIIDLLGQAKTRFHEEYYNSIGKTQGVKNVISQRGDDNTVNLYSKCLKNARIRAWAIGMSNTHLVHQHTDAFLKLLQSYEIDVVIVFWSPFTKLLTPKHTVQQRCILAVQEMIEKNISTETNWETSIRGRQDHLKRVIGAPPNIRGRFRIINISRATNFSCFILDDEVFFFPFLGGPDSTNEPTIHCDATLGIGKRVVDHIDRLINGPISTELCEIVYDSKGDT